MMNFPSSPTNGQKFTAPNGRVYVWDGQTWKVEASASTTAPHSGGDWEIRLNPKIIDEDVTVPAGWNGMTAGPVEVADGKTVSIADGSTWTVV